MAIRHHPLSGRWSAWTLLSVAYLALFSAYWVAALASTQGTPLKLHAAGPTPPAGCLPGSLGAPAAAEPPRSGRTGARSLYVAPVTRPPTTPPSWLSLLQAHLVVEVRDLAEIKHFCNNKLGIR